MSGSLEPWNLDSNNKLSILYCYILELLKLYYRYEHSDKAVDLALTEDLHLHPPLDGRLIEGDEVLMTHIKPASAPAPEVDVRGTGHQLGLDVRLPERALKWQLVMISGLLYFMFLSI